MARRAAADVVLAPEAGVGVLPTCCCIALVEDSHLRARSTRRTRSSSPHRDSVPAQLHHVVADSGLGQTTSKPWNDTREGPNTETMVVLLTSLHLYYIQSYGPKCSSESTLPPGHLSIRANCLRTDCIHWSADYVCSKYHTDCA